MTPLLGLLFMLVPIITAAKQPHILLVVADDYGYNDIGYHGSEIKTPHLDKLAAEGVKLENYYIQPICTPSRSQLMSGRYQIHTGLQHGVIRPTVPNSLPLDDRTMADELQKLGYSTHIVGKWHLGFYKDVCTPTQRGFDTFFGYYTGAEDYFKHTRCDGGGCGFDLHDDNKDGTRNNSDSSKGQYSADIFSERIQKIVKEHVKKNQGHEKPLFMYAPFQSVHAPLEVPKKYEQQYKNIENINRRTYAGMVSAMDEAVGNLTDIYKAMGLWDNTILVFSTDNGGQVHAGGNNWPLRGWKGSLWEGGIHGVGFVSGGYLKKSSAGTTGTSQNGLVHITDWFPTLVKLAGGDVHSMTKLDGHDVWGVIQAGKESPRKELLHNIDPLTPPIGEAYPHSRFDTRYRAALRVGDYKLITGDPGEDKWIPPPHVDFDPEYLKTEEETSILDSSFPSLNSKGWRQKREIDSDNEITSETSDSDISSETSDSDIPSETSDSDITSETSDSDITSETSHSDITSETSDSDISSETSDSDITSETSDSDITSETSDSDITSETSDSDISSETSDSDITSETSDSEISSETSDNEITSDNEKASDTVLRFSPSKQQASKKQPSEKQQNVWLFNIKNDPTEHKDLSGSMPSLVLDMLNRLADYNATAVPCIFPKADPKANPDLHGGYWKPWE